MNDRVGHGARWVSLAGIWALSLPLNMLRETKCNCWGDEFQAVDALHQGKTTSRTSQQTVQTIVTHDPRMWYKAFNSNRSSAINFYHTLAGRVGHPNWEAKPMLSKQRCPHTGIVNFFTQNDPFLSVGSIMKQGAREGAYCWRWYDASRTITGIASDMRLAEERLRDAYGHRGDCASARDDRN